MAIEMWIHSEPRVQVSCDDCGALLKRAAHYSGGRSQPECNYFASRAEALACAIPQQGDHWSKWQQFEGKLYCQMCSRGPCGVDGCTDVLTQKERNDWNGPHRKLKHQPKPTPEAPES